MLNALNPDFFITFSLGLSMLRKTGRRGVGLQGTLRLEFELVSARYLKVKILSKILRDFARKRRSIIGRRPGHGLPRIAR